MKDKDKTLRKKQATAFNFGALLIDERNEIKSITNI